MDVKTGACRAPTSAAKKVEKSWAAAGTHSGAVSF
jgi:hypothetical protein